VVPPDPQDVTRDVALELSYLTKELLSLKADADHWLAGPEYGALRFRLEAVWTSVPTTPMAVG
jgi:hypothetical protein